MEQQISSSDLNSDIEEQILRERHQALLGIERDVSDIAEVMRATSELAAKQGVELDSISDHISNAVDSTSSASQDLGQAESYRARVRNAVVGATTLIATGLTLVGVYFVVTRRPE